MQITLFNIFKIFSEQFDNLIEMIPLSDESEVIDISENSFLEVQFQYQIQGKTYFGNSIVHVTEEFINLVFEPTIDISVFLPLISYDITQINTPIIEASILNRIEKNIQLKYQINKQLFVDNDNCISK